jgi:hypothetical protein
VVDRAEVLGDQFELAADLVEGGSLDGHGGSFLSSGARAQRLGRRLERHAKTYFLQKVSA